MPYNDTGKYVPNVFFSTLAGKTITEITTDDWEQIDVTTSDGKQYRMNHSQDCCESVNIESIVGDLQSLVGQVITIAEESSNSLSEENDADGNWHESTTWTFYKLASIKGHVDIRWCGSSNGYYSESVDFVCLNETT